MWAVLKGNTFRSLRSYLDVIPVTFASYLEVIPVNFMDLNWNGSFSHLGST